MVNIGSYLSSLLIRVNYKLPVNDRTTEWFMGVFMVRKEESGQSSVLVFTINLKTSTSQLFTLRALKTRRTHNKGILCIVCWVCEHEK